MGSLRFANIDVKPLTDLQEINVNAMRQYAATETVEVGAGGGGGGWGAHKKEAPPSPPVPQPEKISMSATVQCAFQIL